MSHMAKRNQSIPQSFEAALKELEEILAEIEGGQIGLEQSLTRYERGNFLIQHCRKVLDSAEKQIEALSKGPNGELQASTLPDSNAADDDSDE